MPGDECPSAAGARRERRDSNSGEFQPDEGVMTASVYGVSASKEVRGSLLTLVYM